MRKNKFTAFGGIFVLCLFALNGFGPVNGQIATGGTYTLDQAVLANGGGAGGGGSPGFPGFTAWLN